MAKAEGQSEKLVEVAIAHGTYHTEDGVFGPGKSVKVTEEEAARLKRIGTVRPDDYQAPAETQDGQLKIKVEDGPSVTS